MPYFPSEYREIPSTDLLSWLFSGDELSDDKDIYVDASDDSKRLNTRQTKSLIRKLVAGFRHIGLNPGDGVCIYAFNSYLYSALYLGIIGAGGVFVGSNPGYTTFEMNHLFSITDPKYFIIEADLLDKTLPALLESNIDLSRIFILDSSDIPDVEKGLRSWEYLLQHGEQDWIRITDESIARSTTAALMSTSGTTGLPKAAAISHYAQVASGISMELSINLSSDVRRLISLPQFHAFAAPLVHIAPLKFKQTTFIMRRFDRDTFSRYLNRYKISETAVVPPMIAALTNGCTSPSDLQSLQMIYCAGSPLSQKLNERMYSILPHSAVIAQNWGMTELGWVSMSSQSIRDRTGSVGKLLANIEGRVVDDDGHELTMEAAVGELEIKSPSAMNGYLANGSATENAFHDGWIKTGDVGYFSNAQIYIVDRIKDLIKVRGWQVSPSELESILMLHPSIVDAAVVPFWPRVGDMSDELPRAYVVLRSSGDQHVSEENVKQFVRSRVVRYKALDGGVIFVDSIPRNASGKVLKRKLIQRARADSGVEFTLSPEKKTEDLATVALVQVTA